MKESKKNKSRKKNINKKSLSKNQILIHQNKELADELRNHDIYITASRFEPCGFHHIEGSSCGMPILYHQDSGGINEACLNHGLMFKDFEEFKIKLEQQLDELDSVDGDLTKKFVDTQEKEQKFLEDITKKYGEGSLNPETGVFTANKSE